MSSKETLSILDALENLNILVDAESLDEIEVSENAQLISHKNEEKREEEAYWVGATRDDLTVEAIKTTFRTVLNYLQSSYTKMKESGDNKRLVEGINTIMVLVGEATRKLERFGVLFREKVTDFKEYKELQNFYRNRVIKETYKEFTTTPLSSYEALKKSKEKSEEELWEEEIQELIDEQVLEAPGGVHLLNDLEVIKRDHLYELFYLKNEGGHPFYTYQLARNMKLACDFGEFAQEYFGDDPLLQIKNWEDKSLHLLAKHILNSSRKWIEKFYKQGALQYKEMDLVMSLHNALMALMLAAHPRNLIRQFSLKGCHRYFSDFQMFLREVLLNREYQKFLLYSPPASQPFFVELLELVQSLCFDTFSLGADTSELRSAIKELVHRINAHESKQLSSHLENTYLALGETLKKHPNGPLFKAVDLLREENHLIFDPLLQGNIPTHDGNLQFNGEQIRILRIPCPTVQETINQAFVTDEFKTYLAACTHSTSPIHHLILNFQDRTSWKEHARCEALEELGRQAEFAGVLTVITMSKDTDFYNQSGPYLNLNEASEFIQHFREHLGDEATGYAFPIKLKQELFPNFIDSLLEKIHSVFFDTKKIFSLRERLDFIELTYEFLTLKILEIVSPSHFSIVSKDSLDITGTSIVGLYALLALGQQREWKNEELEQLQTILFGPTLLVRERVVHPERF